MCLFEGGEDDTSAALIGEVSFLIKLIFSTLALPPQSNASPPRSIFPSPVPEPQVPTNRDYRFAIVGRFGDAKSNILCAHDRASSSRQSQIHVPSLRVPRFEPSSPSALLTKALNRDIRVLAQAQLASVGASRVGPMAPARQGVGIRKSRVGFVRANCPRLMEFGIKMRPGGLPVASACS